MDAISVIINRPLPEFEPTIDNLPKEILFDPILEERVGGN